MAWLQGAREGPAAPALLEVGPTFLQAVTAVAPPEAWVEGVLPFTRTALEFQTAGLHLAVLPERSRIHFMAFYTIEQSTN